MPYLPVVDMVHVEGYEGGGVPSGISMGVYSGIFTSVAGPSKLD